MSGRAASANETNLVPLTCIRTGSSLRAEIKFDLSGSLADLKQELERSNKLGEFDVAELRLFYLGRELKNGGRSLESLGVGTHNVNVIHVHPAKSASSTWKAAPVPARAAASSAPSRLARSLAAAASRRVGFAMMPPSAAAARPMTAGYNPSSTFPVRSLESFLLRGAAPGPPSSNDVIEIDDDEVKVASQPRSDSTNLLAGLRSAMAGPRNTEVFNVDDDEDDDGDDVEDDDVVVMETRPAAKRQRHE